MPIYLSALPDADSHAHAHDLRSVARAEAARRQSIVIMGWRHGLTHVDMKREAPMAFTERFLGLSDTEEHAIKLSQAL